MGRNIHVVCHRCRVQLMMLRGKESGLHKFLDEHSEHEKRTEIYNDYVIEPPEEYKDLFDDFTPNKSQL